MFPQGRDRYVTVSEWNDQLRISVRQYLKYNHSEQLYPTKKGISLTVENWVDLMFEKDKITAALDKISSGEGDVTCRHHIGRNIFVILESGRSYVNIRQWWLPEDAEEVAP